jgi:hypothetical protein
LFPNWQTHIAQPAVKAHRHFHPATQVPSLPLRCFYYFYFILFYIFLLQQFESLDYDPYDSSETMQHASGKSSMVRAPPRSLSPHTRTHAHELVASGERDWSMQRKRERFFFNQTTILRCLFLTPCVVMNDA